MRKIESAKSVQSRRKILRKKLGLIFFPKKSCALNILRTICDKPRSKIKIETPISLSKTFENITSVYIPKKTSRPEKKIGEKQAK
jgi:hypothetical protein